jgi:hypothetical protein
MEAWMNSALNFNVGLLPLTVTLATAASVFCISYAQAGGKGHAAHQHGVAKVNIVAEGNTLTIQLEAPSDSIYGFEHEAKKPVDVKKRDDAIEKLKINAEKMFLTDSSLGCKISNSSIKPFVTDDKAEGTKQNNPSNKQMAGTHSEVHAVFKFECSKPLVTALVESAGRLR